MSDHIANQNILPKIVMKQSRIEINNYNLGDCSMLEYLFSIYDPISHARYYSGVEYDAERRCLIVPRGMSIDMLIDLFGQNPINDISTDPAIYTSQIPIRYLARDDRQLQILKFLNGIDEYSYTKGRSQLLVNSTTGSGKTFVTIASMCLEGSRLIVITSSINWLYQWNSKILEYTPLNQEQIYMISGKSSIDRLFTRDPLQYQVFLASHATLHSYAENHKLKWNAITNLFRYLQCGTKVYDECHLYFTNMYHIDYYTNTRKTIYLSATPERSSREENLIYQEYFRSVPSIELFDPLTDPHVNYITIYYNSHPSPYDIKRFSVGQFNFDRNKYMTYLTQRPNFLKLVSILIDRSLNLPGKILIYIGINDSIEYVYNYIISEFPNLQPIIGIYTSRVDDKELKEHMLRMKFILSTTKSTGAAQDIPDLGACIVLNEPFKSKVIARQTLGRCRNPNTFYIDCVDIGSYRVKIYHSCKQDVFNTYAKSCSEINLTDEQLDQKYLEIKSKYSNKQMLTLPYFVK